MKTVVLTLLVLLVVSQTEALRCYCGGKKQCSSSTETCYGSANRCGSTIFHFDASYSKGCMSSHDCSVLNQPGLMTTNCCASDLCNR